MYRLGTTAMDHLARLTRLLPSRSATLITIVAVALATAVQLALEGVYGSVFRWVPYCFAVFAAAWYGGLRSALLALLAGYLVITLLFISPGTLGIAGQDTFTAFAIYLAFGLFAGLITESLHRARRHAEQIAQQVRAHHAHLSQREAALRESRNRLQTLLDIAPVAIGVAQDRDCTQVTVNSAFAAMLGVSRDRNVSKSGPNATKLPFRILKNGREIAARDLPMRVAARTGRPLQNETLEIIRDDGTRTFAFGHAAPVTDSDGRVGGSVAAFVDITQQRQAEAALRESEQRFRVALGSGAVTVFEQDLHLCYSWVFPWDPAFNESNIGKTDLELLPDPDGRELMQLKAKVIRTGRGARRVMRLTLPSGIRYYDLIIEARRDSRGGITGICGAALDVTSQKLVENALKRADQQKDEFLAMLAHELRNPLAAIRYANDAARLGVSIDEQVVETIDHQVRHLTRLIDDLLDVSRISRGKIQLSNQHLDLAIVVQRAIGTVRPLVEARHHDLSLQITPAPMPLFGDATRLEQVVLNLLTNAAKYTPEGGKIDLSAAPLEGEVVLRVRDNGIGIPPEMLSEVFELFSQIDNAPDRSHGGLGIGLTLTRRLVEMHGGTITAISDGIGRGSEFVVQLPLAEPPVFDAPAGPTTDALAEPSDEGLRVLIVDDSAAIALMLSRLLESKGYVVAVAPDGFQGLEAVRQFEPDVVLLDIGMPRLSGHEVARRLRASDFGRELILIAISGYGQEQDIQKSKEAGFDHHLVKPVSLDALLPLLKHRRRHAVLEI
jgi:PAS domain S-box-containing protein